MKNPYKRPSLRAAFALGVKESRGDWGMTYGGNAESLRSKAYDKGRTAGRVKLGLEGA